MGKSINQTVLPALIRTQSDYYYKVCITKMCLKLMLLEVFTFGVNKHLCAIAKKDKNHKITLYKSVQVVPQRQNREL